MGLFDQIKEGLLGNLGGEGGSGLAGMLDHAMGILNNPETGGLSGLIESFKNKGLGEIASSWVSTGKNLPISAEQIQQVLGSDTIRDIAAKANISMEDVSSGLSRFLPQMVDKLTPNGKLPEE